MPHSYTPGLTVSERLLLHKRRQLPIPGSVLVQVGDPVTPETIVARAELPGKVHAVNVANLLGIAPDEILEYMNKREGDRVGKDEVFAESKPFIKWLKTEVRTPAPGTIESTSTITGQVLLREPPQPLDLPAYVSGRVTEVISDQGVTIETRCALIQGIFGIGGEAYGRIVMACASHTQELTADLIKPVMKDCVIVGGARMTDAAIERARAIGAAAVVSGGMDDEDLRDVLGYDLGVAITGSEEAGITLIITEGFGEIAMAERTFKLLASREGADASVNGATQIRAGVMRPEILIPLTEEAKSRAAPSAPPDGQLTPGRPVRIIRDPYFGLIGSVADLPPEPQTLESGSKARVLEVKLDSGESVIIPRANVELIEG